MTYLQVEQVTALEVMTGFSSHVFYVIAIMFVVEQLIQ